MPIYCCRWFNMEYPSIVFAVPLPLLRVAAKLLEDWDAMNWCGSSLVDFLRIAGI